MNEMTAWLRACLDDDEKTAKAAAREAGMEWSGEGSGLYNESDPGRMPGPFYYDEGVAEEVLAHIALHDPAAVLADIAAKRAVLDEYEFAARFYAENASPMTPDVETRGLGAAIALLARAYRHRPGFKESWGV